MQWWNALQGTRKVIVPLLMMVCLLLTALGTSALAEGIDVSRSAELSISYVSEGTPLSDVEFKLYRVADVDAQGSFTLGGQFANAPVSLRSTGGEELRDLARVLSGYVELDDSYTPDASGRTDSLGRLRFNGLRTGLYLVMGESITRDGRRYNAGATMVSLPIMDEHNNWNYVVTMRPKAGSYILTQARVVKQWMNDGGVAGARPASITVHLLQDGEVYDTQTITAEDGWEHTWTDLNGESVWNVVEDPVPANYDVTVAMDNGVFTLINRYNPPPTPVPQIDLQCEKQWIDDDNAVGVRPESINVTLLANGEPTNIAPRWINRGAANTWAFVYEGLPAVDETGANIRYTLAEEPVPYYQTTINGTTIVNELIPQEPTTYIDIAGTKTWVNDTEEERPESITVQLLRDGAVLEERTVTAGDDWAYSFGTLPQDNGYGHVYAYEVTEQMVSGYYLTVDGYNLTNVRVPTREPGTPPEPRTPRFREFPEEGLEELIDIFDYDVPLWGGLLGTGAEVPVYPFVFGGIGCAAVIVLIVFGRKKKKDAA